MKDRRTASTSLSAKVIEYLRRQGYSQADVARMLHVSEGYVSLVKHRERSLTIDHFELLASTLRMPLGAFLLAVTPPPRKPDKRQKQIYEVTARLVALCDDARAQIMGGAKSASRSRKSA